MPPDRKDDDASGDRDECADTVPVTRAYRTPPTRAYETPPDVPAGVGTILDDRYRGANLLGRGGMGEVRRCTDTWIGRDIAMKVMRAGADSEARERFLREVRLQGQLEHPAIVPVYDVGASPDGHPFFTMKQLRGSTLRDVIDRLNVNDATFVERFTRRRLLTDFTRVAQAVAFAHSTGVVHRDLKPTNIMFGDFGEVYVLDWGIAKVRVMGEPKERATEPTGGTPELRLGDSSQTRHGVVLGTIGYMAPEQLAASSEVDARADVYALGAILFEILTGTPLNKGKKVEELIRSTAPGGPQVPSARAPEREIPPELDAVCLRATAFDPAARYTDVEAMVVDIERFLDGDRDLQRRRELADEHATRARMRLQGDLDDLDARAEAMQLAGKAIAFDPGNDVALEVLSSLLLEPPRTVPPEVERELGEQDNEQSIAEARIGMLSFVGWLGLVPVFWWMGVRDTTQIGVFVLLMLGLFALSLYTVLRGRHDQRVFVGVVVGLALVVAWTTLVFGPLLFTPMLALVGTTMFMLHPAARLRPLHLALGCGAFMVPYAVELVGVVSPTYEFVGDAMVIRSRLVDFPAVPTQVVLIGASVAAILALGRTVASVGDKLRGMRLRLTMQAWHLGRLIPRSEER